MIKIALSGKAKSGKNTAATIFQKHLSEQDAKYNNSYCTAFADPIKEMVLTMFPQANRENLFGASELRGEPIPGIYDSNKQPIPYRQPIIDIGSLGRSYRDNLWIDNLFERIHAHTSSNNTELIFVTDVRYINEFEALKNNGFVTIRIKRSKITKIKHSSEIQQDQLLDSDFTYVISNNKSIEDLDSKILKITQELVAKNK